MYIFAGKQFLSKIDSKHSTIIAVKAANQDKILRLSANKYGKTFTDYSEAVYQSFISIYGMTPAKALDRLAKGQNVAGKDWSKGVYGIGAVKSNTFADAEENGQKITVDESTGHILVGSTDKTETNRTVYAEVKGNSVAYQQFYTDYYTGITYCSQYDKSTGKYYAESFSYESGEKYNAAGKQVSSADSATVWENIELSTTWLEKIINWLISLFGGGSSTNTLNKENTQPNQQTDGFTYQAGMSTTGMVLLGLAAAGAIVYGGKKGKK